MKSVVIGVVERAHGVKGEVKVKPLTDFPQRFKKLKTVNVELTGGLTREVEIIKAALRRESVYLTLKGIDTREEAEALRGGYLHISLEQLVPLAADEFYHFEVIGFEVRTTEKEFLGIVDEVLALPANDVLVVKAGEREHLIPVVKDVIKKIDRARGQITIHVIDGLLD